MGREIKKIINSTFVRDVCHANGVKISEEALKEMGRKVYDILHATIEDTKSKEIVVIQRRHVEWRF